MARDYASKTRRIQKRGKTSALQSRIGLIILAFLMIVVFAASLSYLAHQDKKPLARKNTHKVKLAKASHSSSKPHFEFYNILSQQEVVPQEASQHKKQATQVVQKHVRVNSKKNYVLQVASFKQRKEAEKLRAELILLGFNAKLKTIKNKGQKWRRVQVGPYKNMVALKRDRSRLKRNHYESLIQKTV